MRYLIMCAPPQKKLSHPSRDRRAICVSTADPRMCSHPINNISTCHCAPRPFHGFARGIGQSFSCSMDVLVVSALPSVVALVVHVLHVDDGLFACSGSIAVGSLRTEQRNVDRRAKRISVPVLTPCQCISVPQDQMKSPESAKSFMLYVPFRGI